MGDEVGVPPGREETPAAPGNANDTDRIGSGGIDWPPSPPRLDTPPALAQSLLDRKRQHSATFSTPDSALFSTPVLGSPLKKARKEITGAAAIENLTSGLSNFGSVFMDGVNVAAAALAPPPSVALSPTRKIQAIRRAQEVENDLDDARLASLIRIFQSNVDAADAYMVIERNGVWCAWIDEELDK